MYTECFADGVADGEFVSIKASSERVEITVGDCTNAPATSCVLEYSEWRALLRQLHQLTFPPRSYDD